LLETKNEKEELAIEADFSYGLDDLVKAIRMPQVNISEFLTAETIAERDSETELRRAFSTHTALGLDPYRLIPIVCPDGGLQPLPLKYDPNTETRNTKTFSLWERFGRLTQSIVHQSTSSLYKRLKKC
jgi:hypothetical protein